MFLNIRQALPLIDLIKAHALLATIVSQRSPALILGSIIDAIPKVSVNDDDEARLKIDDLKDLTATLALNPTAPNQDRVTSDLVALHIADALRPLVEYNFGFFDEIFEKSPFELAAEMAKGIMPQD